MGKAFCRTSHLTLRASDLARSRRFYEEALNLHVIGEDPAGRLFLAPDPDDRAPVLVLEQAPDAGAPGPRAEPDPYIGMEHFAFEIDSEDFAALRAAYRRLKRAGAEIHHTVDHRVTESVYFLDPDRNLIEVYINTPRERYRAHMDHPYTTLDALDARLEGEAG